MAEILFNQNIELCGFNIGLKDISYPSNITHIDESVDNSIVYSFVNDDTYKDNSLYGIYQSEALTRDKYIIYRQSIDSNIKTYLATIDGVTDGFWDYNVGRGEKYKYIVETMPNETSESVKSVSLETAYFANTNWNYWSICDIEKSLDYTEASGVDIYIPSDTVFLMKGNINSGSINDNIKTIKYDTLGLYGRVILNQQKYDSGNISCLINDFEVIDTFDNTRNIIIIDSVYNQTDFDNVFKDKIVDMHLLNYDNYYFSFPNYSSKYYMCNKEVCYDILTFEPLEWSNTFDIYYVQNDNNLYINVTRLYSLVDKLLDDDKKQEGPPDFKINYTQYYIKLNNDYILLTYPVNWETGKYYTLVPPEYESNKYYMQIIDYKLVEAVPITQYKIVDSINKFNAWRTCISNGKLKLLKAPNGCVWIVSIFDQNSIDIDWRSLGYPTTINFNWQEVVNRDKISIIKW